MSKDTQISSIDDAPAVNTAKQAGNVAAKRQPKVDGFDINLSGTKKTITIHTSNDEGGQDAVPIGLNGYMYQVPRGVPVEVPVELVHILDNAKVSSYHPAGPGKTELIERVSNRFAFSVH